MEFLSDLQSQLPTRRYANFLLQDLHLLPTAFLSPMFNAEGNGLLRDLFALFSHYTYFSIDDQSGAQQSRTQAYDQHCARLATLQRTALKHFKEKLKVLALSNYASIDQRGDLEPLFASLTDEELAHLTALLDLRAYCPLRRLSLTKACCEPTRTMEHTLWQYQSSIYSIFLLGTFCGGPWF